MSNTDSVAGKRSNSTNNVLLVGQPSLSIITIVISGFLNIGVYTVKESSLCYPTWHKCKHFPVIFDHFINITIHRAYVNTTQINSSKNIYFFAFNSSYFSAAVSSFTLAKTCYRQPKIPRCKKHSGFIEKLEKADTVSQQGIRWLQFKLDVMLL